MAKLSVRKGGITFYPDDIFEFQGWRIPEKELIRLADTVNLTKMIKQSLAAEYVYRLNQREDSQ